MKVKATQEVHIRSREPWRRSDNKKGVIYPGFEVVVVKVIENNAQVIDGNGTWYLDKNGDYYWSGGFGKEITGAPDVSQVEFDHSEYWWHSNYKINELWKKGLTGLNVKLGVIDTGISLPHPDLTIDKANLKDVTGGADGTKDWTGHGTHVAGIIKGSHNGFGVQGIAPEVDLFVVKMTHDIIGDSIESLAEGINWLTQQKVDIISISKGFQSDNQVLKNSIERSIQEGILVVCSAGNVIDETYTEIDYPALYPDTISIGGVDSNKDPLPDTIVSEKTDLFAPGDQILSTFLNSTYDKLSGSSQAVPYVASIAALLLQQIRKNNSTFKALGLKDLLMDTGDTKTFGNIINPLNALKNLP